MICPVCKQEVSFGDRHYLYPLEQPYLNILFHFDCYQSVKNEDNFMEIIHNYINLWYNEDKITENGRKRKRTRKN